MAIEIDSIDTLTRAAQQVAQPATGAEGMTSGYDPSLQDFITQTQQTIEELQERADSQETIVWVLAVVAIAALALAVYTFVTAKQLKASKEIDEANNNKDVAKESLRKLEQRLTTFIKEANDELTNRLETTKSELLTLIDGKVDKGATSVYTAAPKPDATPSPCADRKEEPKANKKYFTLQEAAGQLTVKERNLKDDDSKGWFVMEIDGSSAKYDINQRMVSDILSDQAVLRLCANDFEANASAKNIKTLAKGTMRKDGQQWVVTNKITIELV